MTDELKRCPFCGSRAHVFEDYGMYTVNCSNPSGCVGTCYFQTYDEAVKTWNTRNEYTCHNCGSKMMRVERQCQNCGSRVVRYEA